MPAIERVAILGPAPPDRGGIARETALLAAELARRARVAYFTWSRPYPPWLDPRRFARAADGQAAVSAIPIPFPIPIPILDYRSPASWNGTAREIASFRPDSVIAPWWTSFWGLPFRAVFRRIHRVSPETTRVLLCHNVEDHEPDLLRRFLALGAFGASDAFVVHAETDRVRVARLAPGRPTVVLPHPVVAPRPSEREAARRDLGLASDSPLVLFLGLVRRYKGVDVLLEAAPRMVSETGARIAVVGEVFRDARGLTARAEASPVRDAIVWRDEYVSEEEMARWLAASDVVVLPYRYVSGSGIAARAIAAGRPIAAAAVGGLTETVRPGETGELFPAGDSDGLADAVARVLARGTAAYAPGLARAAEESSWPRYVDRLLAFLTSIRSDQTPGRSRRGAR